jgi:GNAT superfamily N-acetyltransferase
MDIRDVDLADPTQLRAWYAALHAAHRHDRPEAPYWTEDEALALMRSDDPEERLVPFGAYDAAGSVAGAGIVFLPLLDNLDKAYAEVSTVPGHRGRGVGAALVSKAVDVAAAAGRKLLVVEGHYPLDADESHPVRRFAARHGFTLGNSEIRRTLELPIPEEQLRAWAEDAAAFHVGYEIRTYVDLVPVALRPSYVRLLNQLAADAPTGDIDFEAGGKTVEVYEEQARQRMSTGRSALISVAVRDGEAVAHSVLSVPPGDTDLPHLSQWGTLVREDHRGHRLGLAVKAANLRAVQEAHPGRTLVNTSNSPVNGPMVAINEQLGFRPVEINAEFVRRL